MPAPVSQPEHGRDPSFDPYHNWLGIPPEEQPPNHYRLLGLRLLEDNPEVIDNAADQRMTYLRTLQTGKHILLSQRLLNEVAAARLCLLRADTKTAYDTDLRSSQPAVSPIELAALSYADPLAEPITAVTGQSEFVAATRLLPREDAPREEWNWLPIAAIALGTAFLCLGVVGILVVMRLHRGGQPGVAQAAGAADPSQHALPSSPLSADPAAPPPPPGLPRAGEAHDRQRLPDSSVASVAPVDPKPALPLPTSPTGESPAASSVARVEPPTAESAGPAPAFPSMPEAGQPTAREPVSNPASPGPAVRSDAPDNDAPAPRQPIPSGAALRQIETQIDELYHPRAAASPAAKVKLARELLEVADKSKDNPNERFVLFRHAATLACEAANTALMLDAVESLAAEFDVQGPRAQADLLIRMLGPADNPQRVLEFLKASAVVIACSVTKEDYGSASRVSEMAHSLCDRPVGGKEFRQQIRDRHARVAWLHQQHQAFCSAAAALDHGGDHAQANTCVGRWHCFVKGDWGRGLPYLAKGQDQRLSQLAQRELTGATDEAQVQNALGDAWWEWAQDAEPNEKPAALQRAQTWYERIDPQRLSGITRVKLERRQDELESLLAKVELPDLTAEAVSRKAATASDSHSDEDSDDLRTLFARGLTVATQESDMRQAERLFGRCIQMDGHHIPSLNNCAVACLHTRNYRRAVQLWKTAVEAGTAGREVRNNLALLHQAASSGWFSLDRSLTRTLDQLLTQTGGPVQAVGRSPSSSHFYYMPLADDRQSGGELLDRVCFRCNGLGALPCPARGCSRGTVGSTRPAAVARDPVSGTVIMQNKTIRVRCSQCAGRGQVDCPSCNKGRI